MSQRLQSVVGHHLKVGFYGAPALVEKKSASKDLIFVTIGQYLLDE